MELNLTELGVQIFNFLLLFFLLRKFLWKRFLGILDDRREKIAKEFKTIEDTKTEIARLQAEYTQKLNQIEETARARIQLAIGDGQRIAQEIQSQARSEAQQILSAAREDIQFELKKTKEELKLNVIDLTIRATEKMIQEKLDPQTDKKLVEGLLKELDTAHER